MIQNPTCVQCKSDLQSSGYELYSPNEQQGNNPSLVVCGKCRATYVVINIVMTGNFVTYVQHIELHPVQRQMVYDGLDKHLAKIRKQDDLEFTFIGLSDKDVIQLKNEIIESDTVQQFLDSIKNKQSE